MPPSAAEHPNVEILLLLRLLGQTEHGDVDWCSGPPLDWRVFANACDLHQVTALAFCRLNSLVKHAVPAGLSAHLRERFYKISLSNYLLAKKLVALTSRLEQENIPVLAYKGPAVAMAVYGDLALREYQDLDLVIHEEHLPNALEVMARAGFRIRPEYRIETRRDRARVHHAVFHAPDQSHVVELHWQLTGNLWHAFSPDVEKLWSRSEALQLPHGPVSTMCREDLLLALCCHGTRHRWWCLKWLVDVAELLRSPHQWDWSRIKEMTENRRAVSASTSLGILLAHELLGAPVPTEAAGILPVTEPVRTVAEAIREEILLHGHAHGDHHRTLLLLEERRAARMKYRGRWWFREVINVCPKDRALIRLPDKLEFLYRYIRVLRLTVKYTTRGAQVLWSQTWRRSVRKAVSDRH